jgi:hypothetical protein
MGLGLPTTCATFTTDNDGTPRATRPSEPADELPVERFDISQYSLSGFISVARHLDLSVHPLGF